MNQKSSLFLAKFSTTTEIESVLWLFKNITYLCGLLFSSLLLTHLS